MSGSGATCFALFERFRRSARYCRAACSRSRGLVADVGKTPVSAANEVFRQVGIPQRGGIVAVCDHASNPVPGDIELGSLARSARKAYRLGHRRRRGGRAAGAAARYRRASRLRQPSGDRPAPRGGFARRWSRNRATDILIPGNIGCRSRDANRSASIAPITMRSRDWLDGIEPELILSIHSFTPELESDAGRAPVGSRAAVQPGRPRRAPRDSACSQRRASLSATTSPIRGATSTRR